MARYLIPATLALMLLAGGHAAANVSVSIDPMVLEFNAGYGGEQHAQVSITNSGSQPEIVTSRSTDWRTSTDGDVVFERTGNEGTRSLTSYLTVQPASFVLQPGETRLVTVSLQMPPSGQRDAITWGGFILQAAASGAVAASIMPGGTIFVYNTVGSPERHMRMLQLSSSASHASNAIVRANLINDSKTYVRPRVQLVLQRNGIALQNQIVPENVIFPGQARTLAVALKNLAPGNYQIHLLVDYGEDSILDGVTNVRVP